jgi:hypothetical protein
MRAICYLFKGQDQLYHNISRPFPPWTVGIKVNDHMLYQKREREKSHEDANQNSSPLVVSYSIFIAQARSFLQKIRQVYVKQLLARYASVMYPEK